MENGTAATKGEGYLSRMALNDNKAGMEGLDRDKINKIIMESSKGSKFYENELKKEHQVNQRIEKMMLQKAHITEQQLKTAQAQVEMTASELEKSRDLSRVIVHVDMDAFYAAVEMRDCPDLKDKPMAVGSMSMLIREIFADYDPQFQPVSLDEAYLDFTEHLELRISWPEASRTHRYSSWSTDIEQPEHQQESEAKEGFSPVLFEDSPSSSQSLSNSQTADATGKTTEVFGTSVEEAVREMRFRIEQKTMLTASAGIAPNMMLAKVCSDKNKPNGQYRLASNREAVMDFIQNLPVRKVSGIGKVSEKMLNALDISSCAHLGQQMALLSLLFSETAWRHFMQVSLGLGSTYIVRNEERKSMSTERTFKELNRPDEQLSLCRELCEDLAQDLKKEDLKGKSVTLKLKNVNFEVKTRAVTLPCAIATADEIFALAKDLLKTEIENESPQPLRLRLMGVRISAFVSPDDKKPLQKSIVGFLQSGKADVRGSTQEVRQQFEGDHLPSCSLTAQTCQTKEEVIRPIKKKGLLEDQPVDRPQLSFFQRAHAKRLQLQVCSQERENEQSASVLTLRDEDAHKRAETPKKDTGPKRAASHLSETDALCPSEARPSTSRSALNCLTCPVCFSYVSTDDLNVFNSHIDQCLSKGEFHISNSNADVKENHLEIEVPGTEAHEDQVKNNQQVEPNRPDQHHLTNDCVHNTTLINGDSGTVTSHRPRSDHDKGPVLVCPVCHLTQETNDLAIFNCHVDLCLNQEVLHEMGTSPSVEIAKRNVIDRSIPPPRQAGSGKSKRRDSPSYLPSKKARGQSPHNTIDKFFR
ncbi:DNA polymerase kappa isoform X2 [Hippocampus comes]|uniref:DNA polymerase kappa isoform X2 n=1 Tax=Hippocampus comes TaxID=109280 RepID=UPI00094E16FF|nr:PREDICTED: DNA polymerase kappa isoform X2 [Hippocampus comes]